MKIYTADDVEAQILFDLLAYSDYNVKFDSKHLFDVYDFYCHNDFFTHEQYEGLKKIYDQYDVLSFIKELIDGDMGDANKNRE